ncbi:MAG: TIR domain-containing protein [Terracidiphilus sp.]
MHDPAVPLATALSRLRRLLDQIPELRSSGRNSPFETVWRQNVEGVLTDYFGPSSWQLSQFKDIDFFPSVFRVGDPESKFVRHFLQGVETAEQYLKSRISEMEEQGRDFASQPDRSGVPGPTDSRGIFVVHGHDHGTKDTVARFLTQMDLEPIVLHEQPDKGRTVIEKFEDYSEVQCAVVILSPDDVAYEKSAPTKQEERARQNVILELGFFIGKLGRDRTFALLLDGVSQPSDLAGILYIPMSDDSWRMKLVRELKAAGIDVDANKAI